MSAKRRRHFYGASLLGVYFHIFFALRYSTALATSAIDNNGLYGEPRLTCGVDALALDVRTRGAFMGRVFVKGRSQERDCQALGDARHSSLNFVVRFEHCGLTRTRELNGVSISITVVISFHPIFITKVDRAYRVNCFYAEKRREIVSQYLEVGQITTHTISTQSQLPICRYDILANGPTGGAVKYAKIGDLIYHRWSCASPNDADDANEAADVYCMRVHSCAVDDGQGGVPFFVLDENGCESDSFVLQSLHYVDDLTAGQYAYVFKFADRPTLHFNCQIELTLRDSAPGEQCRNAQPKCTPQSTEDASSRTNSNAYVKAPPTSTLVTSPNAYRSSHAATVTATVTSPPPAAYSSSYKTPPIIAPLDYGSSARRGGSGGGGGGATTQNSFDKSGVMRQTTVDVYGGRSAAVGYGDATVTKNQSAAAAGAGYGSPVIVPADDYGKGENAYDSDLNKLNAYRLFRLNGAKYRITQEPTTTKSTTTTTTTAKEAYGLADTVAQQQRLPPDYSAANRNPPPLPPQSLRRPALTKNQLRQLAPLMRSMTTVMERTADEITVAPPPPPPPTTTTTTATPPEQQQQQQLWTAAESEISGFFEENEGQKKSLSSLSSDIDVNYQDEMDAFVHASTPDVDFLAPFRAARNVAAVAAGRNQRAQRSPRHVLADVRVPEQTLVVIDIDESPLANNLLRDRHHYHASAQENNGAAASLPATVASSVDYGSGGCVSYPLFAALWLCGALVAALFSALLTPRWQRRRHDDACAAGDAAERRANSLTNLLQKLATLSTNLHLHEALNRSERGENSKI